MPIQISETEYIDLVILTDRNLERIKNKDPFELKPMIYKGTEFESLKLIATHITYGSAEDVQWLTNMVHGQTPTIQEITERFYSGYKVMDDDGREPSRLGLS